MKTHIKFSKKNSRISTKAIKLISFYSFILSILIPISANTQWQEAGWVNKALPLGQMIATADNKIIIDRGNCVDIMDTLWNRIDRKFEKLSGSLGSFLKDMNPIDANQANYIYYIFPKLTLLEKDTLFVSKNNGVDWEVLDAGKRYYDRLNSSLAISKNIFFGGSSHVGIAISLDAGKTWKIKDKGIKISKFNNSSKQFLLDKNNTIYLAQGGTEDDSNMPPPTGGLYISRDLGETWEATSLQNVFIKSLGFLDDTLFVRTMTSVNGATDSWKSSDYGRTFTQIDNKHPEAEISSPYQTKMKVETYLNNNDSTCYFFTGNNNVLWQMKKAPEFGPNIKAYTRLGSGEKGKDTAFAYNLMHVNQTSLYARARGDNAILKFSRMNKIPRWDKMDTLYKIPKEMGAIMELISHNNTLYAYNLMNGNRTIMSSKDDGMTWETLRYPPKFQDIYSINASALAIIDNKLFVGTKIDGFQSGRGLYISDNLGKGEMQQQIIPGEINQTKFHERIIFSIFEHNDAILVGTNQGLYRSKDKGKTWEYIFNDITSQTVSNISAWANDLYCIANGKLYKSDDLGTTWQIIKTVINPVVEYPPSLSTFSFSESGTMIMSFVQGTDAAVGIHISKDQGKNSTKISAEGFGYNKKWQSHAYYPILIDETIFAAGTDGGIYYKNIKADDNVNFKLLMGGMQDCKINAITSTKDYVVIGTSVGFYRAPRAWFKGNSVDEPRLEPILLYPNPSSTDYVSILLDREKEYNYTIVDNSGKTVATGIVSNNRIKVSELAIGSYVVKIFNDKESYNSKFIKK